jgi:hypothetical protein
MTHTTIAPDRVERDIQLTDTENQYDDRRVSPLTWNTNVKADYKGNHIGTSDNHNCLAPSYPTTHLIFLHKSEVA